MFTKSAQTILLAVGLVIAYPVSGQNTPRTYEEAMAVIDSLQKEYYGKLRRVFGVPTGGPAAGDSRVISYATCVAGYESARSEIAPLVRSIPGRPYAIPDTSGTEWATWVATGRSGLADETNQWLCWMDPPPERDWWLDRFQRVWLETMLEMTKKRR